MGADLDPGIVAEAVDDYLTTAEVARKFRQPESTVRYWHSTGRGPRSIKIGRRRLYPVAEVERWLAELRAAQAG